MTTTSRGIGRSRSPIAAAITFAMRTSPFTAAVASDSVPRTFSRGFERGGRGEAHFVLAERREHLVDVAQEDRARARPAARPATRGACGACRGGTRRGAARPRSCRCRDRRATTRMPARSARIASSCSAWMVATMSRMRPVRSWSSAASSAPSPTTVKPDASAASASNTSSSMPMQAPAVGLEVAAAGDAHRLDRGRPVEGLGDRRAPVDDQRREVVVGDRDAADVERLRLGGARVGSASSGAAGRGGRSRAACRRCRGWPAGDGCRPRRPHARAGPGGCRPG